MSSDKLLLTAGTVQKTSLWDDISCHKAMVVEPRGSSEDFNKAIRRFKGLVDKGKGAIFLAVCRGKVLLPFPLFPGNEAIGQPTGVKHQQHYQGINRQGQGHKHQRGAAASILSTFRCW